MLTLFLLPGYVAAVIFTRNAPRGEISDVRFLLQVAFWGALVHLLILPWTGDYLFSLVTEFQTLFRTATPFSIVVGGGLYFLVAPAGIAFLARFIIELEGVRGRLAQLGLSTRDTMPTAWDVAFAPGRTGAWLYVYIKGQPEPILGEFGIGSIAGVSPYAHDLFLKRRFEPADGSPIAVPMNQGTWIAAESIDYVDFFAVEDQPTRINDGKKGGTG